MNPKFVITGTDTDVGKTIVSAMLVQALDACYFKPVQAGLDDETDSQAIKRLCGLGDERVLPEIYRLNTPASPHYAAEIDGVRIDPDKLAPPDCESALIIEGAGGLMVPLTQTTLFIDLFESWQIPVILCARTTLGTINHTLLSLEAMKGRDIAIHGIVFVGQANSSSEQAIVDFSDARRLGRLPHLDVIDSRALQEAFESGFRMSDFA